MNLELFLHLMIFDFSRFLDSNLFLWFVSWSFWNRFDVFHDIHSVENFSEDCGDRERKERKGWAR